MTDVDDELQRELRRSLSTPEHRAGFHEALAERLGGVAAEVRRDAAVEHRRPSRRLHLLRNRRLQLVAAAACAIALLSYFALFGLPQGHRGGVPGHSTWGAVPVIGGPEPARAADIIASSLRATGATHALRGVMTSGVTRSGKFIAQERVRFAIDDSGSIAINVRRLGPITILYPVIEMFSQGSVGGSLAMSYDARARRERWLVHTSKPQSLSQYGPTYQWFAWRMDALAAGPPYRGTPLEPYFNLRALTRALLGQVRPGGGTLAGSPSVTNSTMGGRRVWIVRVLSHGNALSIIIDKATRFPLRLDWQQAPRGPADSVIDPYFAGTFSVRISDLQAADSLPSSELAVPFPRQAHVLDHFDIWYPQGGDVAFAPLPLKTPQLVRDAVGSIPFWPSWLPSGYGLAQSTYVPTGDTLPFTPSLAFRRGFDAAYVSVRLPLNQQGTVTENGRTHVIDYADPFFPDGLYGSQLAYIRRRTVTVVLRGGAFDGAIAHIVIDPEVLPHLWVRKGYFTATVAGDLSMQEMVRVAESLGQWHP